MNGIMNSYENNSLLTVKPILVAFGFITTKYVSVIRTSKYSKGKINIIEVTIKEVTFILVNLYNANIEVEKLKTLWELDLFLEHFLLDSKNIAIAEDLNLSFNSNLEASRGSPTLWHHGVVVITTAQLHSTKPELRLCTGSNPACGMSEICDGEDL